MNTGGSATGGSGGSAGTGGNMAGTGGNMAGTGGNVGGTGGSAGTGGNMAGTGGGGNTDAGPDAPPPQARTVRVVSTPVRSVVAGEAMRYRVVATDPTVTFRALELPEGATLDSSGNLFWTPTTEQSGPRRVAMSVKAGDEEVTHEFIVKVATASRQRTQAVDPNAPESTSVTVDSPLSPIRGAGVQIDPGSLIGSGEVSVSISALDTDNAPLPPSAVVRKVSPGDLKPIELGPSGTAFRKAARVQLPVSAAVAGRGRPEVLTINPVTGAWEKVKLLEWDEEQGIATAEIEHFSTYVVAPEIALLQGRLSLGAASTACERSLILRASLTGMLRDLPASFVNGYGGGADDTLGTVLDNLGAGKTLQVFLDATARANDGAGERGWLLLTATRNEDPTFRVRVTGSHQSGPFLTLPDGMGPTSADLMALLSGQKAHLIFNGLGDLSKGVSVTAEVSMYLVDGADADRPPLNAVNHLTRETFIASAAELLNDLPGADGYDRDCDQAPDSDDMDPNGDPPPKLSGSPTSPIHLVRGESASLKVTTESPNVTFNWSGSDATLQLSAQTGDSITIQPSQTGVYQVVVVAHSASAESRLVWDVLVDAPEVKTANTPPEVKIASSAAVARVGDIVALLAVGRDREQPDLRFRWSANDPAVLQVTQGDRVPFLATAPGDYTITCVASDGLADSAPATLVITVLAASDNRPPEAPSVTPLSAMVTHLPGIEAQVTLHARSVDPDGDPVTFDFVPDPSVSRAVSLTREGNTAVVKSLVDGAFVFYVTAQDPQGATSPATAVKVQVVPAEAIMTRVDSDGDGYPAGVDCNDSNVNIWPGAKEICADEIDQNCDGRDLTAAQCDADGDRFTTEQGDCDDRDPARNPRGFERCDGVDNNCNGQIDELYKLGESCVAGTGACRATGTTRCSATLVGAVCDAQPGRPVAETCDMVDNDCNGKVDDVGLASAGTVESCGACGGFCPQPTNAVAACVLGGCVAKCAPGYIDLDRNPGNGCECAVSNSGIEICDGLDNNCNGQIDDGITQKVYEADPLTIGVGVCRPGYSVCRNGVMVQERPAQLPGNEVCDGLDNDCNGKVDELFDLQTDDFNCGGCGIVCPTGVKCASGRCGDGTQTPTLPPPPRDEGSSGQVQIGICPGLDGAIICVDLLSDPANCGGCGTVCAAGQFCGLGTCISKDKLPAGTAPPPVIKPTCPLPPPPTGGADAGVGSCPASVPDTCKTESGRIYCTNLLYDNASCGACGVACQAGAFCRDGRCIYEGGSGGGSTTPICREPFKLCSDPFGGSHCTDLTVDPRNCGGCGIACTGATFCAQGRCQMGEAPPPPTCYIPTTNCGTEQEPFCTDPFRDPGNCGTCGRRCTDGTFCKEGACVSGEAPPPVCYPPMTYCKTPEGKLYCTDTFHDPGNCGSCGRACPAGDYCKDGLCHSGELPPPECSPPRALCRGPRDEFYCTDPTRDPNNCGGCNLVCPVGTYCEVGQCLDGKPPAQTCETPLKICTDPRGGNYCTDPRHDPANCGGCGIVCGPGKYCYQGMCGDAPPPPVCEQPYLLCTHPMGGSYCTDPRRDPGNCGGCGNLCPDGLYCNDGRCQDAPPPPQCDPPMLTCKTPDGFPYCTDPKHDPRNCGGCGQVCGESTWCSDGQCVEGSPPPPMCLPPMTVCQFPDGPSYCTDPARDPKNCGQCGLVCPPETYCAEGRCIEGTPPPPGCEPPMMTCQDPAGFPFCTAPWRDSSNCGACGVVCAQGTYCAEGRCIEGAPPPPSCDPPMLTCMHPDFGLYCTDPARDPHNCGGCGNLCPPNTYCGEGRCIEGTPPPPPCDPPMLKCTAEGGFTYCTDPARDPGNCGGCGIVCGQGTYCDAARCVEGPPPMSCPPSMLTCQAPDGPPYCADPLRDPGNCGACGRVCPPNTYCGEGQCLEGPPPPPACEPPFATCMSGGGTYCADLQRDRYNCGTCNTVCPPNMYCGQGQCLEGPPPPPACEPPFTTCMSGGGTYCADLQRDRYNCGTCNTICGPNDICNAGVCGPPPMMSCNPPLNACPGPAGPVCVDFNSDPFNCGMCNHYCPGGGTCQGGACVPPPPP
jgi:hypothetical protein